MYLFDRGDSHTASGEHELEWFSALDVTLEVLIADVLALLTGVESHFKEDVRSWGNVAFHWPNGEVWLEALGVPFKSFHKKKKRHFSRKVEDNPESPFALVSSMLPFLVPSFQEAHLEEKDRRPTWEAEDQTHWLQIADL